MSEVPLYVGTDALLNPLQGARAAAKYEASLEGFTKNSHVPVCTPFLKNPTFGALGFINTFSLLKNYFSWCVS